MASPQRPSDDLPGPARKSSGASPDEPRVTLVVRPGCHLCDDARQVVARVAAQAGTRWTEVSLAGDEELTARYGELVPVVLVDGAQHAVHRVDADRLREALRTDGSAAPAWLRRWARRPAAE